MFQKLQSVTTDMEAD